MKCVVETQTTSEGRRYDLEFVRLSLGRIAYRLTTVVTSLHGTVTTIPVEGIALETQIAELAAGKPVASHDAVIATAALPELIRKYGMDDPHVYDEVRLCAIEPFTRLTMGVAVPEDLVVLDFSNHTISDHTGAPLPVALHFSYLPSEGDITDATFDLRCLLDILLTRDDITLTGFDISRIPGYNSSKDRTQFIEFWWHPSVEDYRRLLDLGGFSLQYAAVEHDLLGIKSSRR